MTDLVVDRFHARAAVSDADDEARVRALLADLTGRRLAEVLDSAELPRGLWFVRRLDVSLILDDGGDLALGRRWARTVTDALTSVLTAAGPDVAHYPRRADAITDLVAALALGDHDRQWAWRAAGALAAGDPDPATFPGHAATAALARDTVSAVHVLGAAATRAGLPALHRLLGASGWQRVAAIVLTAAGQRPDAWLRETPATAVEPAATGPARLIAAGIAAGSTFATAWRRSRLRPDPPTARAWAALAAVEVEPALLRRPGAAAVLAALPSAVDPDTAPPVTRPSRPDETLVLRSDPRAAASLGPPLPAPTDPTPPATPAPPEGATEPAALRSSPAHDARPSEVPPSTGSTPVVHPGPSVHPGPVAHPAVELTLDEPATPPPGPAPTTTAPRDLSSDTAVPGRPTAWGGLVHLLATASEAGIPDDPCADEQLDDRPPSWILFHLARLLTGDAPDAFEDPTVLALAGLPARGAPPNPDPTAAQRARLDRYADRWARATADRLGSEDDPRELVRSIAARTGVVEAVAGWVEVRLRLDDVDVGIRRAGLDIDPGWVSWLGSVVVIRYA